VVVNWGDYSLTGHLTELFGDRVIDEGRSGIVDVVHVKVEPQEPYELSAGRLHAESGTTASLVLGQGTPPGCARGYYLYAIRSYEYRQV